MTTKRTANAIRANSGTIMRPMLLDIAPAILFFTFLFRLVLIPHGTK
jgi:hypothetical protein